MVCGEGVVSEDCGLGEDEGCGVEGEVGVARVVFVVRRVVRVYGTFGRSCGF